MFSTTRLCTLFLAVLLFAATSNAQQGPTPPAARLLSVQRIWDAAPHSAFTDLVRWKGKFYCAFREGKGHAGDIGKLRVIVSPAGQHWQSAALLAMEDHDLRDAALSVTPDGRLMVMGGAQRTVQGDRQTGTFVSFCEEETNWSAPEIVVPLGRWLWRVTWHEGKAYGVSYATNQGKPFSALLSTKNGTDFKTVVPQLLGEGGWPTEARLRFADDGTCYCLHRRDGAAGNTVYFGASKPPYEDWTWRDLDRQLGGPNFLRVPGGHWIAAGRLYDGGQRTELLSLDVDKGTLTPILRLPSGGDTSYPGMVWHKDTLWVSYYSSHEDKTSVYLAKVKLDSRDAVRDLGARRELFVDGWLVDRFEGSARRQLHAPQPREKVLTFEKPWEGIYSAYVTVFRDGDTFRMYYRGMPRAQHDFDTEVTCYAESKDGVVWTKPELGLFEVQGTKENNIILARHRGCHNFAPFKDKNPDCPAEHRYKALGGTGGPGLIAFTSPDGIHWQELKKDPVITKGAFDSQNVAFWSEREKQYVCYFRVFRQDVRWIARSTSQDFIHWDEPIDLDFGDGPAQHLYTNQMVPYDRAPHITLGMPTRFMPGRRALTAAQLKELGTSTTFDFRNDCADILLTSSRGGSQFDRSFLEAFIRPGLDPKNWTSRANYAAHGIVPTGPRELSIYVSHNLGYPSTHIRRYTLRPDGFVSINAGYEGGELTTRPLTFQGTELTMNYSTSAAGSIRVEIQDAETGKAIPGYSLGDCPEIIGDQIERTVTWQQGANVAALAGKPVRLRFHLQDADLFSIRFTTAADQKTDEPSGDEASEELSYSGIVVNKRTQLPIAGATVVVRRMILKSYERRLIQETKHKTNVKGEYSFKIPPEQVAAGWLYIELDVEHPDYASKKRFGYALSMIRKNERLGEKPFFSHIELSPSDPITGRVVDSNGKPLEDIIIQSFSMPDSKEFRDFDSFSLFRTKTDAAGTFKLNMVKGGSSVFWVVPDNHAPVQIVSGKQRGDWGDITVTDGVAIAGKVISTTGQPVAGVWVNLEDRESERESRMPVASPLVRSSETDENGNFSLGPMKTGKYRLNVDMRPRELKFHQPGRPRADIDEVFIAQKVEIGPQDANRRFTIQAVPHVELYGQYLDSKGNPRSGHQLLVHGNLDGTWYHTQLRPDKNGKIVGKLPQELSDAKLNATTNEHGAIQVRLQKDGELHSGRDVDLGTIEADITGVEFIRYTAPIVHLKPVDEDGKIVNGCKVAGIYKDGKNETELPVGGVATNIFFKEQKDGRFRTSQMIPDREVTFTASADGYQSATEVVFLPEGEEKELVLVLKRARTDENDPSANKEIDGSAGSELE